MTDTAAVAAPKCPCGSDLWEEIETGFSRETRLFDVTENLRWVDKDDHDHTDTEIRCFRCHKEPPEDIAEALTEAMDNADWRAY